MLRGMLEKGIPESRAKSFLEALQKETLPFMQMVEDIQVAVGEQLKKVIEVSQQLENIGLLGKDRDFCAEACKASAPVCLMSSGETDWAAQPNHRGRQATICRAQTMGSLNVSKS